MKTTKDIHMHCRRIYYQHA